MKTTDAPQKANNKLSRRDARATPGQPQKAKHKEHHMAEEQTQVIPADPRLVSYFRAGYSLLIMNTAEESRAEAEIARAVATPNVGRQELWVWSATDGMFNIKNPSNVDASIKDPKAALEKLKSNKQARTVYIFRDLHAFFIPHVVRLLRDLARDFKQIQSTLIVLTPVTKIPPELLRDAVQMDFELPNRGQIENIFDRLYKGNEAKLKAKGLAISEDEQERIVSAAMGLTSNEAENAFSKAIVDSVVAGAGRISDLVLKEKALAVKKSGVLEYFETTENIDSIGGLDVLKTWMRRRARALTKKAREYGLPLPKGVLLTGVPGSGKSLAAKAASGIMQVPLIRFDISRVFGGLVGQSEEQMRNALQTIDAMGPCIVWLDEMEKAFAGAGASGGGGDSGVTRRVFGNFLTWLQEKTTPSFVIATTNSISGIPPEMLRRGRFDENFFVGLPYSVEREQIFKIHLKKRGRDKLDIDVKALVERSKNYTGAEIEYSIIDAMYTAFDKDREITTADVIKGIESTNPISKAFANELQEMIGWAKLNAVNASLPTGHDEEGQGGRALAL